MIEKKDIKKSPGPPTLYEEKMVKITFFAPQYMRDWLMSKPELIAGTLRTFIQREIDKESAQKS